MAAREVVGPRDVGDEGRDASRSVQGMTLDELDGARRKVARVDAAGRVLLDQRVRRVAGAAAALEHRAAGPGDELRKLPGKVVSVLV